MDIETFFKKVYTVAFRLTGEEKTASDMSIYAIDRALKVIKNYKKVSSNTLEITILEVFKVFLDKPHIYEDAKYQVQTLEEKQHELIQLQEAILTLEPLRRVTIIWRDILGFKLAKMIPVVNRTEKELNYELSIARRQLKDQLSMIKMIQ